MFAGSNDYVFRSLQVVHVNDSKFDAGGKWQYFFDYDFVVVNNSGEILLKKNFKGRDVDFQRGIYEEADDKGIFYDLGSMLSIHYKNKLNEFINDKELSEAITSDYHIESEFEYFEHPPRPIPQ